MEIPTWAGWLAFFYALPRIIEGVLTLLLLPVLAVLVWKFARIFVPIWLSLLKRRDR